MLHVIQVILLTLTLAYALPTASVRSEQEILDNDIDNHDFGMDLPFEAEYYRTSTDRDEFVRPIPHPQENEIDEGDDGIDLDEPGSLTPDCTYHISIKVFYESVDDLDIKLDGLTVKSSPKYNITLNEFVQQSQVQIFNQIKGKNLTNELVNDVINYLRQTFVSIYGYEDYCGVSTSVVTYFTKNDMQVDVPQINEETTELPENDEIPEKETEVINTRATENVDDNEDEDVTEEYQSKTLVRPKLSDVVQDTINAYRALNNWRYSQQLNQN